MFPLGQFGGHVEVDIGFNKPKIHLYLQLIAEFGSIGHITQVLKIKDMQKWGCCRGLHKGSRKLLRLNILYQDEGYCNVTPRSHDVKLWRWSLRCTEETRILEIWRP